MKNQDVEPGQIRGRSLSSSKAAAIHQYIREKMGGRATPAEFVKRARDPNSPMHDCFEWDQRKGHEIYLVWQAREVLASIEVYAAGNWVRQYVNVNIEGAPSYVDIREAMASKDLSKQVIAYAMREAVEWKRRYEVYRELRPIHLAVGHVQRRLAKKEA